MENVRRGATARLVAFCLVALVLSCTAEGPPRSEPPVASGASAIPGEPWAATQDSAARADTEAADLLSRTETAYEIVRGAAAEPVLIHSILQHRETLHLVAMRGGAAMFFLELAPAGAAGGTARVARARLEYNRRLGVDTIKIRGGKVVVQEEKVIYTLEPEGWTVAANPEPQLYKWNASYASAVGWPSLSFWFPHFRVLRNQVTAVAAGGAESRLLVWNPGISANSRGGQENSGVYETAGEAPTFHPLPMPDKKEHAALYKASPEGLKIDIGPFQRSEGKVWFGLTYYDGEGFGGVGGVGSFDLAERKFEVAFGKPVADWSASAILVEGDDLWLGLFRQYELQDEAGGLMHYSLADGTSRKFDVPARIETILRSGSDLYLGSAAGLYVLRDSEVFTIPLSPLLGPRTPDDEGP